MLEQDMHDLIYEEESEDVDEPNELLDLALMKAAWILLECNPKPTVVGMDFATQTPAFLPAPAMALTNAIAYRKEMRVFFGIEEAEPQPEQQEEIPLLLGMGGEAPSDDPLDKVDIAELRKSFVADGPPKNLKDVTPIDEDMELPPLSGNVLITPDTPINPLDENEGNILEFPEADNSSLEEQLDEIPEPTDAELDAIENEEETPKA